MDVDRYRDRAAPVDLSGIDFDAFRDRPLPVGAIRDGLSGLDGLRLVERAVDRYAAGASAAEGPGPAPATSAPLAA